MPKLTTPSQQPVCLLRRVLLPTLQDFRHRRGVHLEQSVNVIWHYHPRPQIVTLTVEEPYRVFDDLGNLRPTQMTLTPTTVEISLQLRATLLVVLNLPKMLLLGTKRFWKRIGEAKRDELCQARFIAMRQITALMPAAKTSLEVFHLWRQ